MTMSLDHCPQGSVERPFATRRCAFTLIELLVVVAIIALLIAILLPALAGARRAARTSVCMSNIRSMGVGAANYATDARSSISVLNWQQNQSNSSWSDLNGASSDWAANAHQAVDIVRRHLGRTAVEQPAFVDRMVERNYWYLVMYDAGYFAEQLPVLGVLCPEERGALIWQRNVNDPLTAVAETGDPDPNSSEQYKRFMPFWTTYQLVPAAWVGEKGPCPMYSNAGQGQGYHLLYSTNIGCTRFKARRMDEVSFPSQKVMAFDLFDRHEYNRPIFFAYPIAKQPLLFFDGQVSMRKTGDADVGWNPTATSSPNPSFYYYTPGPQEPRTLSGNRADRVTGYYRWTRNGLKGVDYVGRP